MFLLPLNSSQHECILNPITALEFYQPQSGPLLVLAGEGAFLKVFNAETARLRSLCQVFKSQTIHGIAAATSCTNDLQVAIWGGSSLTLLNKHSLDQLVAQDLSSLVSSTITVSDWILDVAISPSNDSCVLVTAHNTVLHARLLHNRTEYTVETLSSPSRSILYSADIIWESPSRILVAAGTVFGEIIVWRGSTPGESQVLFTFLGHEGSVFGVDISAPIIQSNGTVSRLLASCSDDRTIRVWDLDTTLAPDSVPSKASLIRETGFGEDETSGILEASDRCIATVLGHASRIWHVKFVSKPDLHGSSAISVLSFGEDSTTQWWSLDFRGKDGVQTKGARPTSKARIRGGTSADRAAELCQVDTFAFHSGKHIWSKALFAQESTSLLVTGGADSKISMFKLGTSTTSAKANDSSLNTTNRNGQTASLNSESLCDVNISWSIDDLPPSTLSLSNPLPVESQPQLTPKSDVSIDTQLPNTKSTKRKKPPKVIRDGFNCYAFVTENKVLATTNFGRVLLGDINADVVWRDLMLPDSAAQDLRSYTVVRGFPELGLVYLACASGRIYAYRHDSTVNVVGKVEGKVADMFKVFNPERSSFELLVTTLAGSTTISFAVDHSENALDLSAKYSYNLPEKFIVTSAGRSNGFLILGARSGLLALYSTDNRERAVHIWTPPDLSAADAITTILHLSFSTSAEDQTSYFLTTDRTGSYSIFSCASVRAGDLSKGRICCVHTGSLPFGPLIEAAWFQGGDLFFYGFKSKSFVIWNETQRYEISNVDCGGAHRSYAYSPIGAAGGGHFIYTKASRLCLHSHRAPSHDIIKSGGHGREIKASAASANGGMLATGAEDTTIRIWRYDEHSSPLDATLDCRAVVQGHTTGIQHLQWHGSEYLFSSGGAEEFFVWAIQPIPGFGVGVVREAVCPDKSIDQDLRIMSFDVSDLPQTWSPTGSLLISLAYSDSTIRTYAYSHQTGFGLLAQGRYKSNCLTQIRHLRTLEHQLFFLTAATDGNLTLWKSDIGTRCSASATPETASHVIVSSRKVLQNSIKSLDVLTREQELVVATGGDDNALAVSVYPIQALHDGQVRPNTFVLRSAHAAALTGLSILPNRSDTSEDGGFKVLSSGNDQRVKEWDVQLDRDELPGTDREYRVQISKAGDVFTTVADVGDLSILKGGESGKRKVVVVGNGIEVWDI